MTMANKNSYTISQPWVEMKLSEYEKNHGELSDHERRLVKFLFRNIFFSNRIKRDERIYQLTNNINLN